MREFLDAVPPDDLEHGFACLTEPAAEAAGGGVWLEWWGDGRFVMSGREHSRHLRGISRARALQLWTAFAAGRREELQREPWQDGDGGLTEDERKAIFDQIALASDREFYESLGDEKLGEPCKKPGCSRGVISHSVFCRVHHFESVKGRACPFSP